MTARRPAPKYHGWVAGTAVLASLLAGCGGSAGVRAIDEAGRTALIQSNDDYGLDALISGQLAINDYGCLGLEHTDGTFHVAIWPSSYSLTTEGDLRDDQGQVIAVGSSIELGGGAEKFEENYPELADLCLGGDSPRGEEVLRLQRLEG